MISKSVLLFPNLILCVAKDSHKGLAQSPKPHAAYHDFEASEIHEIHENLLSWFYSEHRSMPWRKLCGPGDDSSLTDQRGYEGIHF